MKNVKDNKIHVPKDLVGLDPKSDVYKKFWDSYNKKKKEFDKFFGKGMSWEKLNDPPKA